jgi:hypothetical protein
MKVVKRRRSWLLIGCISIAAVLSCSLLVRADGEFEFIRRLKPRAISRDTALLRGRMWDRETLFCPGESADRVARTISREFESRTWTLVPVEAAGNTWFMKPHSRCEVAIHRVADWGRETGAPPAECSVEIYREATTIQKLISDL